MGIETTDLGAPAVPNIVKQIREGFINFSWKYYINTQKFNVGDENGVYFRKLVGRMRDFSKMTPKEIETDKSKGTRNFHDIDFKDDNITEERFGIPKEEELATVPYQLSISLNHGRMHGFFIDNTFCVRWLDPNHALYT